MREGTIKIATSLLFAAVALPYPTPVGAAAGDPCAAARAASPLAPSRARFVITRDIAAYVARHAEIACARLDAFIRDAAPGDAEAAAKTRVVQGELETGVLGPIFHLYPELRDRDLAAADAPGAEVKLGPFGVPPSPRQMGFATARHLRWVSGDAERRFFQLLEPITTKSSESKPATDAAAKHAAAAVLSEIEDVTSEIGFVDAPAQRNYPELWKVRERELEARMPKATRTAKSDAGFRDAAPPPDSVKLTAAAAARIRAFGDALRRGVHGCQMLGISWSLSTRSRGPDDATWHESGPGLDIGGWDCAQIPPDVVRTIDGIPLVFSGEKAERFAGKTIDYVDKRFALKGS